MSSHALRGDALALFDCLLALQLEAVHTRLENALGGRAPNFVNCMPALPLEVVHPYLQLCDAFIAPGSGASNPFDCMPSLPLGVISLRSLTVCLLCPWRQYTLAFKHGMPFMPLATVYLPP